MCGKGWGRVRVGWALRAFLAYFTMVNFVRKELRKAIKATFEYRNNHVRGKSSCEVLY